jgi:hypothetical protein
MNTIEAIIILDSLVQAAWKFESSRTGALALAKDIGVLTQNAMLKKADSSPVSAFFSLSEIDFKNSIRSGFENNSASQRQSVYENLKGAITHVGRELAIRQQIIDVRLRWLDAVAGEFSVGTKRVEGY